MEWIHWGFSPLHLWLNYFAFLPVPAIILGLYAIQRKQVWLTGACGINPLGSP